ncbi:MULTISPECIES: polysaccharide pyruvyl transferase family protein [Bacteroidaceae]|mgnify:CR=1 FL=1|uniref:Polysaccharide pyruvyl transferase domain-containing protein n=1 Tax=Bacteroides acidifaciens TaxID=85831 RepID=A0A7J0A210_9BACE|nr:MULTISPECIES: polysaccharide pyruvyl transferase family protein [Bacteroidaceae]GFH86388.1 hypothetical protein IMSAGC001_01796 [Bacteroides acidifaciens]
MKIAILTQPLHSNYGGILQNYALQTILRRLGHEPVTLDIRQRLMDENISITKQFKSFIATMIYRLQGKNRWKDVAWPFSTYKANEKLIHESHRVFINSHIRLSKQLCTEEEVRQYTAQECFDAYVVGSDQVWRPLYNFLLPSMYLGFLPADDRAVKIAYAASFGTNKWESDAEETEMLRELAQRFDAISVREQSGIDLCRKYLATDAIQLLDPTLLLLIDDYKMLIKEDGKDLPYEKFVFSYVLDADDEKLNVQNNVLRMVGLPHYVLGVGLKLSPYARQNTVRKQLPPPVECWLNAFDKAECVVTDSFHGTVFSILHHRPFVVLANKVRGMARIETLLGMFGLEDRIVDANTSLDKDFLLNGIDWERVDNILSVKRAEAMRYLSQHLSQSDI